MLILFNKLTDRDETCIRFEEIKGNDEKMNVLAHLEFITEKSGCRSDLGQVVTNGSQKINLDVDTRDVIFFFFK